MSSNFVYKRSLSSHTSGPCIACHFRSILLTKTTAAQNEVTLSYYTVRGLYFLAVVFEASIYSSSLFLIYVLHSSINSVTTLEDGEAEDSLPAEGPLSDQMIPVQRLCVSIRRTNRRESKIMKQGWLNVKFDEKEV